MTLSMKPTRLRQQQRTLSPRASFSDDEDAITPCASPAPEPQEPVIQSTNTTTTTPPRSPKFTPSRRNSNTTTTTTRPTTTGGGGALYFDPTDGHDMDDSQLWERMLEIQRTFHCYNSARMSAALLELEMGVDVRHLAPSRGCLNLINDSISNNMTEEERQRLTSWLHENSSKGKRSGGGGGVLWRAKRSISL